LQKTFELQVAWSRVQNEAPNTNQRPGSVWR